MINLEEKFGSYIQSNKTFRIDGVNEPVTGYGYHCDGSDIKGYWVNTCLLYTSPSPRDRTRSRMPSSA